MNIPLRKRAAQGGFTLVEMVIAISLLAIMLAAVVFSFDGARSRAQVLVTAMDEYGNAMIRMRTDIGCYAQTLSSLLEKPESTDTGKTYCDAGGSRYVKSFSNWSGPYVKTISHVAGKIQLTTLAPTISLRSLRYKDTTAKRVLYYIVADGVPVDVARHAYISCNGGQPMAADGTTALADDMGTEDLVKLRCLPPNNTPWGDDEAATNVDGSPQSATAVTEDVASIAYLYDRGRF